MAHDAPLTTSQADLHGDGAASPVVLGERVPANAFPEDFLWGVATSSYQIEGDPLADGAGPSIWHHFSHTPGHVVAGDTGDVACGHYRTMPEDVALMRDLGAQSYRFSIAWSRVFPQGTGRVNPKGLAFYDRLVDELLEAGIAPMATLYHWDLPAALNMRGGWLNRDIASWFADYAVACFEALADRVPRWLTLNEPWVVMNHGYVQGDMAPGHRNRFEAPRVAHNLLRAHAAAVHAYDAYRPAKTIGGEPGQIGITVNLEMKYAADESPESRAAQARADAYMNRLFLDPVQRGRYPEEMRDVFGAGWDDTFDAEAADLKAPGDFTGINYYSATVVKNDPAAFPTRATGVPLPERDHTAMGWTVFPESFGDALRWVAERYDVPIYVTENGAAYDDPAPTDGIVADPDRIRYYRAHLDALHQALRDGADVRGYFAWSLLDNFEWAYGYGKRFGLVHVDFETLARTPKNSARFYSDVIRSNGKSLFDDE